jgi:hypothetical protein
MPFRRANPNDALNKYRSTAESGNHYSIREKIFNGGSIPPHLLGINGLGHGNSGWSAVAHETQQLKQIDNLINDSVSDELVFNVKNKDGSARTTAFPLFGKVMKPDAKGDVRITDTGKLAFAKQIADYRKAETNKLMEYVRLGDDIACYIFGVNPENEWKAWTAKGGCPDGCNMDPTLRELQCNVEYIDSLPPSLTQTQSVAKLRKIVQHLERNVNMEVLSSLGDVASNMKDGHNNPTTLSNHGPFANANQEQKDSTDQDG